MATTRIRKAFRYPSESDDEDEPDELDEEHQERLISDFRRQDFKRNEIYRQLFLAIPLLAGLYFFLTIFTASTARQRWISLLSVSSLVCTAYILHFMPIESPDRKGKRPVYQVEAEKGPVENYLVYLNASLAGLLLLAAVVSWKKELREAAWKEALPSSTSTLGDFSAKLTKTVVFALIMFARQQLAPVDLEDLQKARYEYKGA